MKDKRGIRSLMMNKKGQTLDLVTGTIIGIMIFIFVVFAVLFGISTLNPGSFFTAGSAERNVTNQLVQNTTGGLGQFGQQIPTAFVILGVVFVLGFVALLILIVRRFAGQSGVGGTL